MQAEEQDYCALPFLTLLAQLGFIEGLAQPMANRWPVGRIFLCDVRVRLDSCHSRRRPALIAGSGERLNAIACGADHVGGCDPQNEPRRSGGKSPGAPERSGDLLRPRGTGSFYSGFHVWNL